MFIQTGIIHYASDISIKLYVVILPPDVSTALVLYMVSSIFCFVSTPFSRFQKVSFELLLIHKENELWISEIYPHSIKKPRLKHSKTHHPFSFSRFCSYTFHLWLLIDSCWEVERDLQCRDEKAGCRGRVPRPQGLASPSTSIPGRGAHAEGPRDADQKPALSVRPSHVKAKSQIVLWHVVGSVSDKHTHTNVFWQGVHKYTHGAPLCPCGTF